ncbi:MAG: DUF3772 domain-containing protein, partial [Albidovulum sp.]|nr:DUF3772 domain-containing protein [Albidovulum sp.]
MGVFRLVWTLFLALWSSAASAQDSSGELFGIDVNSWARLANRAEVVIEAGRASDSSLLALRSQIVAWRQIVESSLDEPQQKLERLELQLDALGPEPSGGEPQESTVVAERRTMLKGQIGELKSDFLIGSEIVRRADGLIEDIDSHRRTQKRAEFLTLGPTPLNPLHWLDAFEYMAEYAKDVSDEVVDALGSETQRRFARNNLLQSLFLAGLGILLASRFRFWALSSVSGEIAKRNGAYLEAWEFVAGFLRTALFPSLGLILVVEAVVLSGLYFVSGATLLEAIPFAGMCAFGARWIADAAFGDHAGACLSTRREPRWRRSARMAGILAGWVLGADFLLDAITASNSEESIYAVLKFPVIVAGAYLLVKIGRLLAESLDRRENSGDAPTVGGRVANLIGKAAMAVGALSAVISAVGYITAAEYLVFSSISTFFLLGFVSMLTMLLGGLYLAASRTPAEAAGRGESLFTALVALFLFILSLPVIAWIWGTTEEELLHFWELALDGITVGGQQISISNLLTLVAVFMVGFALTKLAKGVLETTILPNTKLDEGGRKAIATGTGYVGILISLVVSVSLAGIDLTNLAIVAGALSVGLGFGLQAVVSNFVSGLILLIERPVNEGDWIVVGDVSGTVKKISVRSTTVETFDRANVVVPNSDLIASKVTNWTLRHRYGRSIVSVGVAYGTDPRKVERLLLEVARSNDKVMRNPEPQVIFAGFGASSLDFELR